MKVNFESLSGAYKRYLRNAVEGRVVTRFPPEPSGYLHIGHAKAACLNYHYAKLYKGRMLMRFDDTNPAKEKTEFEDAILADLKRMDITPDAIVRTSDHFELIIEKAGWCIENGLAYCDNTPAEEINKLRAGKQPSPLRESTPEQNMAIWQGMLRGEHTDYCLRAKIDYKSNNGCLRDPVIFRHCTTPHQATGDKYKVYPTYDFACPIVDAADGVTHALRTNEYADRNPQYKWFLEHLQLTPVEIEDYSRLGFKYSTLSKRKLGSMVASGAVEGWDDPRFPTLRGILRRGMQVGALVQFMIEQGPSKNANLMEWDRIWATNRTYVDPIAVKLFAVPKDSVARVVLVNLPADFREEVDVPRHPGNPALGQRRLVRQSTVFAELEDIKALKPEARFVLMKWGVCRALSIENEDDGLVCRADFLPDDTNFKDAAKLTWVPADVKECAEVSLIEYGHILAVEKLDTQKLEKENGYFETVINHDSRFVRRFWAEKAITDLELDDCLQFERRCYGRVDRKSTEDQSLDVILIPDGKSKTMSGLSAQVNPKDIAKGRS